MFSEEGANDLMNTLGNLKGANILTCPPYTLTIAAINNKIAVMDSHVIGAELGGNENAAVIIFPDVANCSWWLWKRLKHVQDPHFEVFSVTENAQPRYSNGHGDDEPLESPEKR